MIKQTPQSRPDARWSISHTQPQVTKNGCVAVLRSSRRIFSPSTSKCERAHFSFCEERSTAGLNCGRRFVPISAARRKSSRWETLHVNSFGTWRDAEGRLCWRVDDFDESYPLAYTNDLVRPAASMKIVIDAEGLSMMLRVCPSGSMTVAMPFWTGIFNRSKTAVVLSSWKEHEQKLGRLEWRISSHRKISGKS